MPELTPRFVPVLSGRWAHNHPQKRKLSVNSVAAARWWAQQHPTLTVSMQAKRLAPVFGVTVAAMREALTHQSWARI